jgi:hypothetical protein
MSDQPAAVADDDTFADIEEDDLFDGDDAPFFAAVEGTDLDLLAEWVHGCMEAGVDPASGARIDR